MQRKKYREYRESIIQIEVEKKVYREKEYS